MIRGMLQHLLNWLERLPWVIKLRQRFPRLVHFILARLDPKSFTGLPLTLILLVFGVNLMMLSQLTEDVLESEGIVLLDMNFTQLLFDARSAWVSQFFYFISHFGTREAVFGVGAILTIILFIKKEHIAIIAFWVAMAGTGLSVQYGKKYISRDRPADVAYYMEENYSFPSGHATTSMALYGFCAYLLYRLYRNKLARIVILLSAGLLTLFVGFSRIYLGVHYLSDVLAGFILGFLWVLLGLSVLEWLHYNKHHKKV